MKYYIAYKSTAGLSPAFLMILTTSLFFWRETNWTATEMYRELSQDAKPEKKLATLYTVSPDDVFSGLYRCNSVLLSIL